MTATQLENGNGATNGHARMPPEIAAAILEVMAGVKTLAKDNTNPHQGYDFASIDAFYAAVNPLCVKAGLIVLQDEASAEVAAGSGKTGWLRIRYAFTLAHRSGVCWGPLYRTVDVPAQGAQAYGSAQSYAQKQLMRSVFQIPTGDDEDADRDAAKPLPEQTTDAGGSNGARQSNGRCTQDQEQLIRRWIKARVITDKERKPILAKLDAGKFSARRAHECIEWLKKEVPARKDVLAAERAEAEEGAA